MKRKVVFMFVNGSITEARRMEMDLGQGLMIVVGVADYAMACVEAKKLADEGVIMIELCGGFGTIGHAKVTEAVEGKMSGRRRSVDNHPGYDNLPETPSGCKLKDAAAEGILFETGPSSNASHKDGARVDGFFREYHGTAPLYIQVVKKVG